MKSLNDIISEIYNIYGDENLFSEQDITQFINYIFEQFKYEYPELRVLVIRDINKDIITDDNKLYLNQIDDKFLSIKNAIKSYKYIKYLPNGVFLNLTDNIQLLNEQIAVKLYRQYLNDFILRDTFFIPFILTDDNGTYLTLNKDDIPIIIFYNRIRDINSNQIPEHIYIMLNYYIKWKFFDYLVNEIIRFSRTQTIKLFNTTMELLNTDEQQGQEIEEEFVKSISLGGISMSFEHIMDLKSRIASNLLKNLDVAKDKLEFYDKIKKEYEKKFKQQLVLQNMIY